MSDRRRPRVKKLHLEDFLAEQDDATDVTWQEERDEDVAQQVAEQKRLRALTPNQGIYLKLLETSRITFCTGPAGTGKTYMACGMAAQKLKEGSVDKLILTRPLVTCGKSFGYLPGDVLEKVAPHMRPLLDALEDFFDPKELKRLIYEKQIELIPLELMRGSSFKKSFIICDESQNAEYKQLHMFLTRIGEGCRMVLTGDGSQSDIDAVHNPLLLIVDRLQGHDLISHVQLDRSDVVRDPLVSWIDERLSGHHPDIIRT